jgi:hypothetical protein
MGMASFCAGFTSSVCIAPVAQKIEWTAGLSFYRKSELGLNRKTNSF